MMNYFTVFFLLIGSLYAFDYQTLEVEGEIKEDLDVSAITCMTKKRCFIASDETNGIQAVTIKDDKFIVSNKVISLGSFKKENDLEGATHDGKYFYFIGSHGLSKKNKVQSSRYKIFRLLLDSKNKIQELKASSVEAFIKNSALKNYFQTSIKNNGVNIEGLAFQDGSLFLGFRSPIIKGKAQILKIKAEDIFNKKKSKNSELISLDLKEGRGIRSLEFFDDKLFVLSGQSPVSGLVDSELLIFSQLDLKLKNGPIQVPYANLKAEGIDILNASEIIYVYDSQENGMPLIQQL